MRFLEAALARALGRPRVTIEGVSALPGGCIHEARHLMTSAGEFFAKWSADAPPDLFLREAEGLEALRSAGGEIVVPRVIASAGPHERDPGFLILEFLAPIPPGQPVDHERLGRGLAHVHRRRAEGFGFPEASYCGSTRQDNRACASWPEFYGARRLRPLVDALETRGELTASDRRRYDTLLERLASVLPANSEPALIHGDLWSGNVLWTARGPALVDPACAYADREMEFGITTLFGGLSPRAFSAYEEAWPLSPGWRERNPLYQLYHLLNHAVLFGGHYGAEARRIAMRYAG
jgi:protein-ribulosamine 3-kinase